MSPFYELLQDIMDRKDKHERAAHHTDEEESHTPESYGCNKCRRTEPSASRVLGSCYTRPTSMEAGFYGYCKKADFTEARSTDFI